MINAVNEVTRERAQSFLTESHITQIQAAFGSNDVTEISRLVPIDEIREHSHNLSIPLYVRATESETEVGSLIETDEVIDQWETSCREAKQSMNALLQIVEECKLG